MFNANSRKKDPSVYESAAGNCPNRYTVHLITYPHSSLNLQPILENPKPR
jgi:hypothetical protein